MTLWVTNLILSTIILVVKGHLQDHLSKLPRCSESTTLMGIDKVPDPYNNKRYFICENDILTLKECEKDEIFNSQLSVCASLHIEHSRENLIKTNSFSKLENNAIKGRHIDNKLTNVVPVLKGNQFGLYPCPSKKAGNYPNENDCSRYYHCEDGVPKEILCPQYFLFDYKEKICQFFLFATCFLRTTEAPATTYIPPTCTAENEDIAYPYDCKHYWHCYGEVGSLEKCGLFSPFDRNLRKCRFVLLANCETSETMNSNSEYHSKLSSNRYPPKSYEYYGSSPVERKHYQYFTSYFTEETSVMSSADSEIPQCTKDDDFKKPYPGNCKKFYACEHGSLTVYKCLFIFNFDPINLNCRWFWKVNCNYIPPTTTITTTSILTTTALPQPTIVTATSNTTHDSTILSTISSTNSTLTTLFTSSTSTTNTASSTTSDFSTTTHPAVKPLNLKSRRETKDLLESEKNDSNSNYLIPGFDENYQCRSYGNYDDIYPFNCHKYYHCQEGVLTIGKCSFFKDFDPIIKTCRLFLLVDCQARPVIVSTTTPEPTLPPPSTQTTQSTRVSSSTSSVTPIEPETTTDETSSSTDEPNTTTTRKPTTTKRTKKVTTKHKKGKQPNTQKRE